MEIKEHLEKAQNPIFYYDNDADGLCSFVILRKFLDRGKGVAVRSFPGVDGQYARKARELNADYVFILDKPVVSREFVEEIDGMGEEGEVASPNQESSTITQPESTQKISQETTQEQLTQIKPQVTPQVIQPSAQQTESPSVPSNTVPTPTGNSDVPLGYVIVKCCDSNGCSTYQLSEDEFYELKRIELLKESFKESLNLGEDSKDDLTEKTDFFTTSGKLANTLIKDQYNLVRDAFNLMIKPYSFILS